MSLVETARAASHAIIAGWAARPVFRLRDVVVARRDPAILRAYLSLWRAERAVPPHHPSFEAVRATSAHGVAQDALVWGETPLSVAVDVLSAAGVGPGSHVLDLGAGRGMVLLAARLLGAEARGVEIDPRRAGPAREILSAVDASLIVGDALEADLHDVTHVWLSWTCMPPVLRDALGDRLRTMPPGTRVITLTWGPGDGFTTLADERRYFPWGALGVIVAARS